MVNITCKANYSKMWYVSYCRQKLQWCRLYRDISPTERLLFTEFPGHCKVCGSNLASFITSVIDMCTPSYIVVQLVRLDWVLPTTPVTLVFEVFSVQTNGIVLGLWNRQENGGATKVKGVWGRKNQVASVVAGKMKVSTLGFPVCFFCDGRGRWLTPKRLCTSSTFSEIQKRHMRTRLGGTPVMEPQLLTM